MKKFKAIFITHASNNYGASRSLFTLLKKLINENHYDSEDILLIYNQGVKGDQYISDRNESFDIIKNKTPCPLPTNRVFKGGEINRNRRIKIIIKNTLFYMYWCYFSFKKLRKIDADYIHLNSIILWPLLLLTPKKLKKIIHCREILDLERLPIMSKIARHVIINNSNAIVAIDFKTAEPFLNYSSKVYILNNPFDMRKSRLLKENHSNELYKKYNVEPTKTVITLIGQIQTIKGQLFFLDLAKSFSKNEDYLFLVVGHGSNDYYTKFVKEKEKHSNVLYLGHIKEIEEIYAISDTIVRCEDYLPLGRTLWEAYYSGCNVLLPKRQNDNVLELDGFIGKGVFLYNARDITDFRNQIVYLSTKQNDITERPCDNMDDSIKKFLEITENI